MKIITDSTCDISFEEAETIGVEMIPMKLCFGDEEFIDKITITNDAFYQKLSQSTVAPKTTLINSSEFLEYFDKYKNEEILLILISSGLSGTYNSAVVAKELSGRNDIYILDSQTVTVGLTLLINEALKMKNSGASCSCIYERLMHLREKIKVVAVLDTLKYLVLGGRISKFTGKVGTMLNIKPLICSENGGIVSCGKARGRKDALEKLKTMVFETYPINEELPLLYVHGGDLCAIAELETLIGKKSNAYYIGGVVGTHAGPGAVGLAYFMK